MRIAHISVTYPPYRAGAGSVCHAFASGLAQRGHEVHSFTSSLPDTPAEEIMDGVQIHRLNSWLHFGEARFLPGLLELPRFDLIHLHFPFYMGAELVTINARRTHTPLFISYHMDTLLKGPAGAAVRLYDAFIGDPVLRAADQVVFTTLDYGRASRIRWLLDYKKPAGVLPNGVDTNLFHPDLDGTIMRIRHGMSPQEQVILLVAGMDSAHFFKGVPILLQAFQKIKAMEKSGSRRSRLVIVGEGNLRPMFQAMMIRLGLSQFVTFAGRVSDVDLPYYYAAADIGVLPSYTMGEAFGIVLLEAMACGKPVVASRLPGVRDVVEDGEDGLLVTPGDVKDLAEKINILLDDPGKCQAMGKMGLRKARDQYAWPIVLDRLEDQYRKILKDNPPA